MLYEEYGNLYIGRWRISLRRSCTSIQYDICAVKFNVCIVNSSNWIFFYFRWEGGGGLGLKLSQDRGDSSKEKDSFFLLLSIAPYFPCDTCAFFYFFAAAFFAHLCAVHVWAWGRKSSFLSYFSPSGVAGTEGGEKEREEIAFPF